jgi:exopolysaccharide biosynthesis polyprenyl glycosylphosphotransferase
MQSTTYTMSVNADEIAVGTARAAERAPQRLDVDSRRRFTARHVLQATGMGLALLVAAVVPSAVANGEIVWFLLFAIFVYAFDFIPAVSKRHLRLDTLNEIRDLVLAAALAAMTTLSIRVLVTDDPSAAADTIRVWGSATVFLVIGSVAAAQLELRARREGMAARRVLIIGAGKVGRLTAKRLLDEPELGLRPIGFLDKAPLTTEAGPDLPVLGASWDLEEVVRRHGVEHAIFTFSTAPHDVLLSVMKRCQSLNVSVSVVPRLFERMTTKVGIDHVGGLPLLSPQTVDPQGWEFRVKYIVDRVLAGICLLLSSPLLAATTFAVWISLGRPILYRQPRVGRDGQEFEMLKFRSMKEEEGAEETGFPRLLPGVAPGGVEGIDRRTKVGRLIRRTALDELPQLLNVLRGEMSLVGPRPERPEFAEVFNRDVYRYAERLRVKSGITGWAQIHGLRGQTSLDDRVEWDNYYIENWSLWLDCKILLLTLRSIFRFAAD